MSNKMKWKRVTDELPKLYEVVWIYWRDRKVLLGCRSYEADTPTEGWYSFEDEKCRWTNFWMRVEDSGLDEPFSPEKLEKMASEINRGTQIITFNRYPNLRINDAVE
jgi:hypothetical protein